jgi:putative tryptophan/tyrosine transport system substrate-binding protein
MRRRDFILLLSGAIAASSTETGAQQVDRTRRIGVLMGIGENDPEAKPRREALENGFKELGWTGNRIHLDYRWTGGDVDRTRLFAREIVELKPDVIVVHSTPAVKELRQLTSTIPMVFVLIADPIGSGFVASLNHPGGNLTGFMNVDAPMASKWLELIKEVAPTVKRVALIYNPLTSPYQSFLKSSPRCCGNQRRNSNDRRRGRQCLVRSTRRIRTGTPRADHKTYCPIPSARDLSLSIFCY